MRRPLRPLAGSLAIALALVVGLAACGSDGPGGSSDGGALQVEAAFYPLQWLAEQVGGPDVEVDSLTPAGAEPHDLELTPKEVGRVADADLVLLIGGFQPSVDDAVVQAQGTVFDVADATDLDLDATGVGDEEADADHAHEDSSDPHVWLDPVKFAEVADALGERFAALDPDHAADHRRRAAATVALLEGLDDDLSAGLATCRSRDLVTSHAAFGYFARRYGFDQIGITGISPEAEPSPKRLAEVASLVEERDVRTIYFERLVPDDLARTVADETGATTAVLDPIEGITDESDGHDYPSVMAANLATLQVGQGCT